VFLIDQPAIPYSDPWGASLEQRIAQLYSGRRRVAYFYFDPDNSTFRYRIYNMLECLGRSTPEYSGSYFTRAELKVLYNVLPDINILVLCRAHYTAGLNELIQRAKNLGVTVLFDIDDLVFDSTYVHLVVDTLDQNDDTDPTWTTWFAEFGRLGAVLKMCHAAVTTNPYLADRIRSYAGIAVNIIPNFLNSAQLSLSRQCYVKKCKSNFERDKRIHIGYFSGTPTHNKDFDIVSNALYSLMSADERIMLRIVGFLDIRGPLQKLRSRIEFVPFTDFVNLQRLIAEVEVNIIPLQDNVFTNCKSELKYFEAAIVGTVSVASNVFTLRNAIRHGENGFVVKSWEWPAQLRMVIDTLDSRRYQEIAARAAGHAEAVYGSQVYDSLVKCVLFGVNDEGNELKEMKANVRAKA